MNVYGAAQKSVFRTATSPNLTFLQLEVLLGTKQNKNDKERSLQ
jgi:hypothetical protein